MLQDLVIKLNGYKHSVDSPDYFRASLLHHGMVLECLALPEWARHCSQSRLYYVQRSGSNLNFMPDQLNAKSLFSWPTSQMTLTVQ